MQLEKFYTAQNLRRNIVDAETLMNTLTGTGDIINPEILKNLPLDLRNMLADKAADVIKKELAKIIKQLEKTFSEL